jgi:hypothetical protein
MKITKILTISLILTSGILFSGCTKQNVAVAPSPSPSTQAVPEFLPFTARFEIYTKGTKRIFTDTKYHNQSPDVFIENPDPSIINVTKEKITWDDFFKTLPFSLTKDCLVTGTKQTFCTNDEGRLQFFINGVEDPNALDKEIVKDDFLKVIYE